MTNCAYDITVIVGTYNPKWEKLKATLLSIVKQKHIKLQIVVSDDGSADPLHTEIKNLFKQVSFCDFKLVAGKKNEGTVCQLYRGIGAADSDYVKPFSPGDLLYNDTILSEWIGFARKFDADICFGDSVFHNIREGKLNVIRHVHNPLNMSIYQKESSYYDKVINYACLKDGIYGAAIIAKRSILVYYLKLLLHRVIYVEDYFIRLALLERRKILYYPSKVIWYEFADGGISTTGSKKWAALMHKDDIAMDEICLEKCVNLDAQIRSWLIDSIEFKRIGKPTLLDKLARYLNHPRWFYWRLYIQFFKEYSPVDADDTFFNQCYDFNF